MIPFFLLVACWGETTETKVRIEGFGDDELACANGDAASCVAAANSANLRRDAASAALYAKLGCNHEPPRADACALASTLEAEAGDSVRALAFARKACDLGDRPACSDYGVLLLESGDGAEAVRAFERACEGGVSAGCANLGMVKFSGEIVSKDVPGALALWEQACAGDDGQSCHNLGIVHLNGLAGAAKDPTLGDRHLTRGCELGYAASCSDLAAALTSGNNLPVDEARAAELAGKACKLGHTESCR